MRVYPEYTQFFKLSDEMLVRSIKLRIGNKQYPAKIRIARIRTQKFKNRDVVQIFYDTQRDTLKALRKTFLYSYASTIDKRKPMLKEILELQHEGGTIFRAVPFARQKTDFDRMFNFLEDKNLFEYWKDARRGKEEENFFISSTDHWLPASELPKYKNRVNVIYLLYHTNKKQLYVGKANVLGDRLKEGEGRIGLAEDWDKFMFFEIHPRYNVFIEQIEAFVIKSFASLVENDVGVVPLNQKDIKLVNRQLIKG